MPVLSKPQREYKLRQIVRLYRFCILDELMDTTCNDEKCPGICVRAFCDYTAEVAPQEWNGRCGKCGTRTVMSALVLAGAD